MDRPRETNEKLKLQYEWDGSKWPIEKREHNWRRHAPASHPTNQEQRGPRILFPATEVKDLHDAGLECVAWTTPLPAHDPQSVLVALEVALAGPAAWAAVASVIRTYLTRHKGRKVVVHNDGKPLVEISGDLSVKEIEALLRTQLPSQTSPDATDAS